MSRIRLHSLPIRFAFAAAILASVSACASTGAGGKTATAGRGTASASYTDGVGRTVILPVRPQRIISLAPSVTEVLYLLGVEDRLIGVTLQCDWPERVKEKPRIGSLLTPNAEIILSSHPDLIIASTAGNDQAAIHKLEELGLPVFVTAPRNVEGIFQTTRDIGRITDQAAEGERLVAEMQARLRDVGRRLAGLPPTQAFFITWFDPLLAPGRKTFENDVLRLANVVSVSAASEEFYSRYSLEQVLAQDPDVILTVAHSGKPLPDLSRIAGWRSLRAVRLGRVYFLNETLQHPSPRFVDALEELARKLHPERFR